MKDDNKTRDDLLVEVKHLRQQVAQLQTQQESEANLRVILDNTIHNYCFIDLSYRVRAFSRHGRGIAWQLFGKTLHEGASIFDFVAPVDMTSFKANFKRAVQGEIITFERSLRDIHGNEHWFQFKYTPIFDQQEQIIGVCLSSYDLSQQRHTEQQIRLLAAAVNSTDEGVVITDAQLEPPGPHIIFVNEGFCQMTGYKFQDVIGKNPRQFQGEQTSRHTLNKLKTSLNDGKTFRDEITNYRADGTPYEVVIIVCPIFDHNNSITHYVSIQHDVTHTRRLERQFQQAQKMEAMGRLAGSVAHDFNNMLTVIQGYTSVLLDTLTPSNRFREDIAQIDHAAEQAAEITRQLLLFSRKKVGKLTQIDLNQRINNLTKMILRLIGDEIELVLRLTADLEPIRGDATQIEQVLVNLILNARDAMPNGGQVTVRTENLSLSQDYVSSSGVVKAGNYVKLTVSDTGYGIDTQTLSQIFEPFFTTKASGKGTGLGLSTVYAVIQRFGGVIHVWSKVRVGTRFEIYLPTLQAASADEPPLPADKPKWEEVDRGSETILLVEDERLVRELTQRVLRRKGYTVITAQNPQEALQISQKEAADLLLTDMLMPGGLTGYDLACSLQATHPRIKIVYMSGYIGDAVQQNKVLESGDAFIQKPFTPDTLVRQLRAVLDGETE